MNSWNGLTEVDQRGGIDAERDPFGEADGSRFGPFIGASPPMRELFRLLARVGPSNAAVLLVGESGTGKELAARTLHRLSSRRRGPFVAINCAAIPETLIEGELFGHEKGAFTGATQRQQGCFELANQGTLFLDELVAMPLSSQVKLLRALEDKSFRRLRGREELKVDVRIVAATNEDPESAVRKGRLREDLLYRINVFSLRLPPLRERPSDVVLLAEHFARQFCQENDRDDLTLSLEAKRCLRRHPWPGNVRELRNAMERAVILARSSSILPEDLPPAIRSDQAEDSVTPAARQPVESPEREQEAPTEDEPMIPIIHLGMSLEEATRALMLRTLESTRFNKTRTAEILGVSAKTVYNKLKEWSSAGDPEARRVDALASGHSRERIASLGSSSARLVSIDSARTRRVG